MTRKSSDYLARILTFQRDALMGERQRLAEQIRRASEAGREELAADGRDLDDCIDALFAAILRLQKKWGDL